MQMLHGGPLIIQLRGLELAMVCQVEYKYALRYLIQKLQDYEPLEHHFIVIARSPRLGCSSFLRHQLSEANRYLVLMILGEKVSLEVQHGHSIWVASTLSHDWCNWKILSFGHFDVEYLWIFGMQDCFDQALTSPMEDWGNESRSIHLRAMRGHKCRKNKMMQCHLQTCTQGCCV